MGITVDGSLEFGSPLHSRKGFEHRPVRGLMPGIEPLILGTARRSTQDVKLTEGRFSVEGYPLFIRFEPVRRRLGRMESDIVGRNLKQKEEVEYV